MKRKHFIIALMAMLSCFTFTARAQVAKVGNTEYETIDEAVAKWTNNTTLTLLQDVTLSDVVTLSSQEHHYLALGTYTMTAASSKNAIEIKSYGRSNRSESGALTITADATNPGGINAGSKACIYYKYDATLANNQYDRPIIYIKGGVFKGSSYSGISSNGDNSAQDKCATFNISGGIFNCGVNLTKTKLITSGGTFNSSLNCTGGGTSLRLISGGRFKSWTFMTADAEGKFTIGSDKSKYDVGVYVDDEGYLCVGGPVITELSPKYKAKAKSYTKWSSYLKYSSAATYGLYYTSVEKAGTGATVYEHVEAAKELDNNAAVKDFTPVLPAEVKTFEVEAIDIEATAEATTKVTFNVEPKNASGAKVSNPSEAITFRLPVPAAWSGKANVYHEGTLLGAYKIKEENGAKYVEVSSSSFSEFSVEAIVPTEVEVATLAELQAALADNSNELPIIITETIVIPAGETVTIDLNGKTVTVPETTGKHIYALNNKGDLTLKDTKGNGSITARGIYNGYNGTSTDETVAGAKMTIESGKYIGMDTDGGAAIFNCAELVVNGGDFTGGVAAINNRKMGVATIKAGNYHGGNNYVIQNNGGQLTIHDATVDSGFGAVGNYSGTTVINDGTYLPTGRASATCHVVYVAGAANVTINGGTFKMNYPEGSTPDSGSAVASYYNGTVVINGGSFTSHFDNVSPVELSQGATIKGGTYLTHSGNASNHTYINNYLAENFELSETGTVVAKPVAEVNGVKYASFAEAAAAAQAGSEIKLLANIDGDITVPANVTLNGNGFAISGGIFAEGDITFAGVTTAADFDANVANTAVNIPAGASLQLTGTARLVIGHGATFNITGTIADAKTADKATLVPSLKIAAGASITGNGVTFNVKNAYIVANANTTSKNSNADGTLDFNIENSIWEQTGVLAFYVPTSGKDPVVNFELKNSVLTTTSHLVFSVTKGEIVFDNSLVNQGISRQLENRSTMTIKNGSVVNGAVATSSNAINPGTIIVENATYAVTGEFSGAAEGKGTLVIKKGANVSVGSIKAGANVTVDAEGMAAGDEINFTANLSQFTGELSVINNDKLEAQIVNGKVVLAAKPVAKIGETPYTTIEAAFAAATEGQTITMLDDATPALTSQRAITKAAVIDLGGKTMTLTEDDLYFGTTTFKNGTIVVDPSVKPSTAVFWMFANQTLTFDNVKIVATGVTGTYLIGLEGENSDLNLLNGSEILVENTTALDLDIICVNGTNTCDIKVENSKVNVTNLDGRVFFRGNYTVKDSEVNLAGITKAGFRIEAGQTLSIEGTSKVNIEGEPRDGGIHMTDLSATYTKAETATVNATVNEPKVAKVGENTYRTLALAVAAVEDGGTITLIANETFTKNNRFNNGGWWDGLGYSGDKSFTIDLADFTISQDGALNDYLMWFKNDGAKDNTITLKNGTLDAGTTAYSAFATASSNAQKITVNLENINVINKNSNGAALKIRGGSELNVKAGTIITGENSYLGIETVGKTTVVNIYEGAEIYQNGTSSYCGCLAGVSGNGTINVYGGKGQSKSGGFIAMTSGGTINIEGGEWTANTDGTYANGNKSVLVAQSDKQYNAGAGNSIVNVTGGTFKGGYNCYGNKAGDAQINIKGGNFNADPTSYVAEDYIAVKNNSVWNVVKAAAKIGTKKFATLQEAVNAVQNGETITLTSDVTENVTLTEKVGLRYTINGDGKTLNGKITITPLSDENDNRRITIKNIKFVNTADAARDFISCTETNHYPRLTVEGCTFTGNGKDTDVAVRLKTAYGAVIKDCTGTGLHSFLQNTAGKNLTIENVTVTDSKSGFALGTVQGVTVKGCKANVEGYGIRLDANTYNNNAVIENNAISAFIPVVVRNANTVSDITVKGTNTFNASNTDGLWMAVGTSEYETNGTMPTAATGQVKVILEDKNLDLNGVYGNYGVASIGKAKFNTLAEAVEAAQNGETVELLANVTLAGGYEDATEGLRIEREITLNGNGHTIDCGTFQKGIRIYNLGTDGDFRVNFNNVEVVNNVANGRCIDTRSHDINLAIIDSKLIAQNGNSQPLTIGGSEAIQRVKLDDAIIDAGNSGYGVIAFVPVKQNIYAYGNTKVTGYAAFYLKDHGNANIKLSLGKGTYIGKNIHSGASNAFGTVVLEGDNNVLQILGTNPTLKAITEGNASQAVVLVIGANNKVSLESESAIIDIEGENAYYGMISAENAGTTTIINKGNTMIPVAEVGGFQFMTIKEAIRYAGNEGTIKVVNDFELAEAWTVAAGQNITLDLNGKTISQTKECTASYEMICNKGNLTITDSSDAKDGKISFKDTSAGDSSFGWGSYTVRNEGNLVVENGIIEHLGEQTFGTHCIMAIYQYCGSTTINGGTISTPNYRSARLWKGEMAINGGTFDGQLWVQAVDNTAKLTINGGTFEPNGNDASAVFVTNSTYDVAFAVTGGTFNGKVGCSDATKLANVITGGKFNAAAVAGTSKDLIAFGYEFGAADADGYQTVYNDENVLYIETLADLKTFRDAVNSGANYYAGVNVVLAADIDMAGENWVGIGSAAKDHGFMGNFDGQGYKIKNLTITNPALDSDGYAYAGLFGVTEGTDKDNQNTIKNLTIENVTITTTGHIVSAAIAYPYYTIVDNVKVCGDIKIQGGNYTAGVLAYTRRCVNASNLSIVGNEGSFVKGNQVVGGVISDIQMNGGLTAVYKNFSAEGVTVTGTKNVGGISGIIATQTLNGATVKNVTLNSDNAQVGIVAGCLGGTSTISNVTYENVAGATTLLGATYEGGAITAKIGDTYYATFENAYKAAQEGETITMLAPVVIASGETLTLDKNVTVAYTSNVAGEDMFTNRGTLNISAGTITYANTDATASNVTVSTISSEPGSVLNITGGTVENKTVKADGSSIYSFAIDMLTNGNLGDVTATINGGTVSSDYMAIRQFNNGTACKNTLNITGGHIYGAKRAVQVHIDNNAAYTTISGGKVEAGADGYAICNFAATGNLEVTGGEFIGAVYSALENFISGGTYNSPVEAAYCAAGYMPNKNADGTYGVVLVQDVVASIDGVTYGTLKAAVAAAKAGETITLLQDVKENVTISKHLTIDGAGKTITGMITTDGKSLKVTIKNVNFNGNNKGIYYAVKADDDLNLVVENCSVDSYSYGFLYANKSNDKIVVKNVTVENCASYGAYLVSFNSATFENFTVSGAQYGVAVSNAAARKVSFKNVSFDVTGTPLYIKETATGNVTFNFSGINDMGKAEYYTSQYVNIVAAAQVGTKVCGSLQDAVVAANDGETVKVLSDLNMTTANFVTQVDGYATLVNVAGKAVTIDLNGKTVTVNAAHEDLNGKALGNMLMSVFHADPNGTLTLTDSSAEGTGTVELFANDAKVYGLIVSENANDKSNPGKIIVNGGNYFADKVSDSMIFADINEVITVNGGNFHLDNIGSTGVNGKPWIFNAAGNNQIHINVNGGTYNANVAEQHWTYEVKIGSGFTIRDNGDGTWSVVTGITLVDGKFTEYTNNETKEVEYISYTRNNIPTTWTSIYLPFEVPVSVLADQGFEVAYINGVRRDDKNDDGILDEFAMETIYIHGGDNCDGRNKTLKANYPYFIRTKGSERKNLKITLEDRILYAAEDVTYDCTTMTEKYEITGNSSQMTIVNKYGISGGGWTYLNSEQTLKPFRFYMLITSRVNSEPVIITSPMRIVVRGHENEDGTTTIYDVVGTKQNSDVIYDIHGRRVLDPQKGNLYIINGKKVVY